MYWPVLSRVCVYCLVLGICASAGNNEETTPNRITTTQPKIETTTGKMETKSTTIETMSGSIETMSGSIETKPTTIETMSGSIETTPTTIETTHSSLETTSNTTETTSNTTETTSNTTETTSNTTETTSHTTTPTVITTTAPPTTGFWPNGPYALPTPKYGCPESESRGWRRGYINMTFTLSRAAYVSGNWEETPDMGLYRHYSHILGPFNDYNFQINFCYKTDTKFEDEKLGWPAGKYSIFGSETGCPQGFNSSDISIWLPPILHWSIDGYLPYFDLNPGTGNIDSRLVLRNCTIDNGESTAEKFNDKDAFLLIKADRCPLYTNEVTYPYPVYSAGIGELIFCLQPEAAPLQDDIVFVCEHDFKSTSRFGDSYYPSNWQALPDADSHAWLLIDYGSTVAVQTVHLHMQWPYYGDYLMTVSNERWAFYYNGAVKCAFYYFVSSPGTPMVSAVTTLVCLRPVSGRFIVLQYNYEGMSETSPANIEATITTCTITPEYSLPELQDLGLASGYIRDFQISASTSTFNAWSSLARPQLSGWCAAVSDINPYIQIDVILATTVSGFTIHNVVEAYNDNDMNLYQSCSVIQGAHSFLMSYGTHLDNMTLYNKEFQIDLSRPFDQPVTFTLLYDVTARYIRIYPQKAQACLRLEILGHRQTGIHSPDCGTSTTREMYRTRQAYLPSNTASHDNIATASKCSDTCFFNHSTCIGIQYINDRCILYVKDIPQRRFNLHTITEYAAGTSTNQSANYMAVINCLEENGSIDLLRATQLNTSTLLLTTIPFYWLHVIDGMGQKIIFHWPYTGQPGRIIFTDILLVEPRTFFQDMSGYSFEIYGCIDMVFTETSDYGLQSTMNGMRMVFATPSNISNNIIFTLCPNSGNNLDITHGVRAYFLKEDTPSATMQDNLATDFVGYDAMTIYSLEFTSSTITDYFATITMHPKSPFIAIVFTFDEFFTSCEGGGYVSVNGVRYCNGNRPFADLYISEPALTVSIRTWLMNQHAFMTGFRAHYSILKTLGTAEENSAVQCSDTLRKCYKIVDVTSVRYSWQDAYDACISTGYMLPTIRNSVELEFIKSGVLERYIQFRQTTISPETHVGIFLGLTRKQDDNGHWQEKWLNGQPLTFSAWVPLQHRRYDDETCTLMNVPADYKQTQTWSSVSCVKSHENFMKIAMCERPYTTDANLPDSRLFTHDNVTGSDGEVSMQFSCDSGEHVSVLAVCNGVAECADASDERNCLEAEEGSCGEHEFDCGRGQCVHISVVCDYITDCWDASDEYCSTECNQGEFTCLSGQCITQYQRCDGTPHCLDNTDEVECYTCNSTTAFLCEDATCIPRRLVCDGVSDCINHQDELSCDHLKYKTCDDVLKANVTQSGIYQTVDDQYMECDFSNMKAGGQYPDHIHMRYLNIDWSTKEVDRSYILNTAHMIKYAIEDGYTYCYQNFTPVLRPLDAEINGLDDERHHLFFDYRTIIIYWHDNSFEGIGETHKYLRIFRGVDMATEILINKTFDFDRYRLPAHPLECYKFTDQAASDFATGIFHCGHNVEPIPISEVCTLEYDHAGRIKGCRNQRHLQNCETASCGADYVKCAGSYCIPVSHVCNGRIDCAGGDDELNCLCENEAGIVVIAVYGDGNGLLQQAHQTASAFISNHRRVYIIHAALDGHPRVVYEITQPGTSLPLTSEGSTDDIINMLTGSFKNMSPNASFGFISFGIGLGDAMYNDVASLLAKFPTEILDYQHFAVYRIMVDPNLVEANKTQTVFTPVHKNGTRDIIMTDVYVRSISLVTSMGALLFPTLCKGRLEGYCNNGYMCSYSRVCIPTHKLCDDTIDCPQGDDERLCDFHCPTKCTCHGLTVTCRNTGFMWQDLKTYSGNIKSLTIGSNVNTIGRPLQIERAFVFLSRLNVSHSGIVEVSSTSMAQIPNVLILDLSNNNIRQLYTNTFLSLTQLRDLHLEGNSLTTLHPGAFNGLTITHLSLRYCGLQMLQQHSFSGLVLDRLDLTMNKIYEIHDLAFAGLHASVLDLTSNDIKLYSRDIFTGLDSLTDLKTDSYKFCCFRPTTVAEHNCWPHADEFSSCEDLIRNSGLQALLWIIGLCAIVGNVASIVFRLIYDRARLKIGFGIFVTNLAIADLLMGVYLLIIAVADTIYRNRYIEEDEQWRSSVWCNLCGFLSTISSEASVLFMCLITLDRILVIKYPFGQIRFTSKPALMTALSCWFLVVVLAAYPLLHESYFQGRFYTSRGVCVALPLTRDQPPGWLYSVIIFIGFNLMAFVLIAFGQFLIYREIQKSSRVKKKMMNVSRSKDLRVARNLLLIVTTDFICWFPIGVMGVMAMAGFPIPGEMYAWTVVLILPINSALNPVMYTFSVLIGNRALNPSVDEQNRTEVTTEQTQVMVQTVYKRLLSYARKLPHSCNLDIAIQARSPTTEEVLYIALHLARQLTELHDCNLTVDKLMCDNVLVELHRTNRSLNTRGVVILNAIPNHSTGTKDKANNIYKLGKCIQLLLQ